MEILNPKKVMLTFLMDLLSLISETLESQEENLFSFC